MLPDNPTSSAKQIESRRHFLSEAFHAFHQPLTALHCGLELSLYKERSEAEYRQRIQDALANAGSVLQLSKVVRELAEAFDPGEDLQRVELYPVLSTLSDELSVVAEAQELEVKFSCEDRLAINADPNKLARHIGNLASGLMRALEPGGRIELKVLGGRTDAAINVIANGKQRQVEEGDLQSKFDAIRNDAACSYVWALGGDFRKTRSSFTVRLPKLN